MDYEQMSQGADEKTHRARVEQLLREHSALAIVAAVYLGGFVHMRGVAPVKELAGWDADPQSRDGSGTVVYLTPRIGDRKTVIRFRMTPDEGAVARNMVLPFAGAPESAIVESDHFPATVHAFSADFAAVMS